MKATRLVAPCLLLLAACATPSREPLSGPTATITPSTPATENSPSPSPSPTPTPAASGCSIAAKEADAALSARAVAFIDREDVWLFDVAEGSTRRLTTDGGGRREEYPKVWDATTVDFVAWEPRADAHTVIERVSVGERARTIVETDLPSGLNAFAWSPRGDALAYIEARRRGDLVLRLYRPGEDPPKVLSSLGEAPGGRHGCECDESSVAWSPDGSMVLATDTSPTTNLDDEETVWVVRLDGSRVAAVRQATFARWMADGRSILFRVIERSQENARWYALDTTTGERRPLAMTADTTHPAVSPDGRFVAYQDETDHPFVRVYDLATDRECLRVRDAAAPRWFSSTRMVITNTRPCTSADSMVCDDYPWVETGATSGVEIATGDRTKLTLHSTVDADVLLGESKTRTD